MRVAVVSTPRSGNSWLRCMLASHMNAEWLAVHTPEDLPEDLPESMVVQLHWRRTPEFEKFLNKKKFKVVTISRHPLDVLVSILHFARKEESTDRWLGLKATSTIRGVSPLSDKFREFALSEDFGALLNITSGWWEAPGVTTISYEDLITDTPGGLGWVAASLGLPNLDTHKAISDCDFAYARGQANRHGWQRTPGTWRKLITPRLAWEIGVKHTSAFTTIRSTIDPDLSLTEEDVMKNWERLKIE